MPVEKFFFKRQGIQCIQSITKRVEQKARHTKRAIFLSYLAKTDVSSGVLNSDEVSV